MVLSLWDDPEEDARHVAWTREFYAAMQPWSATTVYVNALSEDDAGRVGAAYGANYARLARVKATYDPANRFRRNQNVPPAATGPRPEEARYPTPAPQRGIASP